MNRIKVLPSHAAHARWPRGKLVGYIPRQSQIPSPYAFSPSHPVYETAKEGRWFIVETRHRRYEVFEAPAELIVRREQDLFPPRLTARDDTA